MTRVVRVAVLECDTPIAPARERYGTYGDFFQRLLNTGLKELGISNTEIQVSKWDVVNELVYPKPEEYDAILMTGSKHDAWSDAPWVIELMNYTRDVYEQTTKHIIGICFGHQILARALGARVGRGDHWELSVGSMALSEEGKQLFSQDVLSIQQMHRDIVFEVPKGFVNLGSTPLCEIQGLYEPGRAFTVQGHPEFDEFVMTNLVTIRNKQGVFDDDLAQDALSRAGNQADGVLIAKTICKLILE